MPPEPVYVGGSHGSGDRAPGAPGGTHVDRYASFARASGITAMAPCSKGSWKSRNSLRRCSSSLILSRTHSKFETRVNAFQSPHKILCAK